MSSNTEIRATEVEDRFFNELQTINTIGKKDLAKGLKVLHHAVEETSGEDLYNMVNTRGSSKQAGKELMQLELPAKSKRQTKKRKGSVTAESRSQTVRDEEEVVQQQDVQVGFQEGVINTSGGVVLTGYDCDQPEPVRSRLRWLTDENLKGFKTNVDFSLFGFKTGSWYSKDQWEMLVQPETVFYDHPILVQFMSDNKLIECIPIVNPMALYGVETKTVKTSLGAVKLSPYYQVVMTCIKHFYGNFPNVSYDSHVIQLLHKFALFRLEFKPEPEFVRSETELYKMFSMRGMLKWIDVLAQVLLPPASFTVGSLAEVVVEEDLKRSLGELRNDCPSLYSVYEMFAQADHLRDQFIQPTPLFFRYDLCLHQFIDYLAGEDSLGEELVCSLPLKDYVEGCRGLQIDFISPPPLGEIGRSLSELYAAGGQANERGNDKGKEPMYTVPPARNLLPLASDVRRGGGQQLSSHSNRTLYSPTMPRDYSVSTTAVSGLDNQRFIMMEAKLDKIDKQNEALRQDVRLLLDERDRLRLSVTSLYDLVQKISESMVGLASQRSYKELLDKQDVNRAILRMVGSQGTGSSGFAIQGMPLGTSNEKDRVPQAVDEDNAGVMMRLSAEEYGEIDRILKKLNPTDAELNRVFPLVKKALIIGRSPAGDTINLAFLAGQSNRTRIKSIIERLRLSGSM